MDKSTLKRLEALEQQSGKQGDSDPSWIYELMLSMDIEAPEPLPGEDSPTWLKRVPDESLEALMSLRGAHV